MPRLALVITLLVPAVLGGSMASARVHAPESCTTGPQQVCRLDLRLLEATLVHPVAEFFDADRGVAPRASLHPRPRPPLGTTRSAGN
ncbi:MAG: hypothetical protein R3D60_10055 [Paracoccaceae bacterium]